jgi:hypothetical protein
MIRHHLASLLRPWNRLPLLLAIVAPPLAFALEPAWWAQRGIISTDSSGNRLAASDYAVINQGQLKNFVVAATAELNLNLPGGAGPVLNGLVATWSSPDTTGTRQDFAAANAGQVKTLAAAVYDRLIATGVAQTYPWGVSSNPASDHALANIGQVKALFAFNLAGDSDGLSLAGEVAKGTSPLLNDTDGDGVNDDLDYFPLDPSRWAAPSATAGDTTKPLVTIIAPVSATYVAGP